MKKSSTFVLPILLVFSILNSCSSSDSSEIVDNAVAVEFTSSNPTTLNEDNHIGKEIEIKTNARVKTLGSVNISFSGDAEYGIDYKTKPEAVNGTIKVAFPEATERYNFKIIPIVNNNKNHDVTLIATLNSAKGGIKLGNKTSHSIKVNNINTTRNAFFLDSNAMGYENYRNTGISPPEVIINFNEQTLIDSQLVVKIETNATEGIDYKLNENIIDNKITFNIAPGQQTIKLDFEILDDQEVDGHKEIKFSLISASGGLKIGPHPDLHGTSSNFTIALRDNESPVEMNFLNEAESLEELPQERNTSVIIRSDLGAPNAGTIKVKLTTDAVYETHYTMYPKPDSNNIISLDFQKGQNGGEIRVDAPNNNSKDGNKALIFEIIEITGGGIIGSGHTKHTLTIIDDD
ncbi:hypothetical protein H3Z83_03070 [Tenacibaculum sp. S7007]|uniref:Calx-beta domain-containing protein n=1 Tax=Tenacibaculum pelagium TaxID=2759527 RepID=A0A839AKB2_9FLAO|nr:hypothetical protein [Tenacibaculum pelagium]MBA6155505.1 hypothetical protein [Tenacibaculum pelagium]